MIIETKNFKDVNRAPYNPRIELKPGMPEYEKLKKSIEEFGHVLPMVYNTNSGNLVGGHQTMTVLEDMGITKAQMSIVDLDDANEKALNIALNKIGGSWEDGKLSELLGELSALPDFDIELTGFDVDEVAALNPAEVVEDGFDTGAALDTIDEPVTKRGDIIKLGRHKIMCGDSTDAENVERLMDGKKANVVFCDPPYGMKLDTDYSKIKGSAKSIGFKGDLLGNKYDAIKGDNEDFKPELITTILKNFSYCKEMFIFGADYFIDLLPNSGKDGCLLVWNKRSSDEQQKGIGNTFELFWSKTKHKKYVFNFEWFGFLSKDSPQEARNRLHPSMKPIGLIERIFLWFKSPKGIVVDLYLGAGSTLIACEQTKRVCYAMEIDPKYIDVCVLRWEEFTGQKVIRPEHPPLEKH